MSHFTSNFEETPEYLTPEDLVDLLYLNINTVYSLCRKGVIPAKKLGRQWRISRQQLESSVFGQDLDF